MEKVEFKLNETVQRFRDLIDMESDTGYDPSNENELIHLATECVELHKKLIRERHKEVLERKQELLESKDYLINKKFNTEAQREHHMDQVRSINGLIGEINFCLGIE